MSGPELREALAALIELSRLDEGSRPAGPDDDTARVTDAVRAAILSRVPAEQALHYKRLLKIGRRPVVVSTALGYCHGCHMLVPPQLLLQVARTDGIHRCPSCQRFLAAEGAPDDPQGNHA